MCDNEPLYTVLRTILNVFVKPWMTVRVGVDAKYQVRSRCLKPRIGPQPPNSTAAQRTLCSSVVPETVFHDVCTANSLVL